MRLNVTLYRTMAYITGVVLIILCILAIMQAFVADAALVNLVGTMHGSLYVIYLIVAFLLARRLRLDRWPTVMLLLAGTVPVMTFLVERHMSHTYIEPALAGHDAARQGDAPTPPQAAAGVPGAEPVPPR